MVVAIRIHINKRQANTMDTAQWITLFEQAFRAMDKKLEQVLRISEHRDRPFRLIVTGHFANA